MADIHHTHGHTTTPGTTGMGTTGTTGAAGQAGKMHAAKEKFMGGVKETLGTVLHAEGLKESGREQKREGDVEALAAGQGKKHYDPALARKGVGIQHKHLGPNPKKLTEGPCAGCKEGTCTEGHAYDAAVCHSCTQGHCDAGHAHGASRMMGAGMPATTHAPMMSGERCCDQYGVAGHQHSTTGGGGLLSNLLHKNKTSTCTACNNATCPGCTSTTGMMAPTGHNQAYDPALCPQCTAGNCTITGHSARDKARIGKMKAKRSVEEKRLRRDQKAAWRKKHGDAPLPASYGGDWSDFNRDLGVEHMQNVRRVNELDMMDRQEEQRLHGKLHTCNDSYHSSHTSRGIHVCDVCGQQLI